MVLGDYSDLARAADLARIVELLAELHEHGYLERFTAAELTTRATRAGAVVAVQVGVICRRHEVARDALAVAERRMRAWKRQATDLASDQGDIFGAVRAR